MHIRQAKYKAYGECREIPTYGDRGGNVGKSRHKESMIKTGFLLSSLLLLLFFLGEGLPFARRFFRDQPCIFPFPMVSY